MYCEGDQSADQGWLSEHLDPPSVLPLEISGPTHLEKHGQVIQKQDQESRGKVSPGSDSKQRAEVELVSL